MSCDARDMIEYHADTAKAIQEFMWEGKPFNSKKKEHTIQEFEEFLEGFRNDSWENYNQGANAMGWTE